MYSSLPQQIKAFILDMDGVIWKDNESIGDIKRIFNTLSSKGLRFSFATNNSTLTPDMYVDKLSKFGIHINSNLIVNSTVAIAKKLLDHFPSGGGLFMIGEKGLISMLSQYGFYQDTEKPLAVVAGMDRQVTYEKLAQATYFIRSGALFFGTNPDKTFPTPRGLAPGAGSILAAIEAASGKQPIIGGKPEPAIINISLDQLNLNPSQVLVIGDRLDTDILSGIRAGCKTALVLSGVSTLDDLKHFEYKPDIVAPDLESIING